MSAPRLDLDGLQSLFRAGRYAELEAGARHLLAQRPGQGRVWRLLGHARLAQGKIPEAAQALAQASALLPTEAPVWSELAACRHALGEREQAADCYRRSLELAPDRAEVWANAGRNALELGRLEEAEKHCRRALTLQPALAEAHFNLGKALAAQGRADEALAAYRKVQALVPDNAEAQNAVASGLLELGRAEAALMACREALARKPDLVEAGINLGNALSQLGRYGEAVEAYRGALALRPNMAVTHSNLGNALWELGKTEAALAAYRRAVQLQPDFAEAYGNLGNALSDLEDWEGALAAYRRVLELAPGSVDTRYRLGYVLRRMRRFDEAVLVFSELAAQDAARAFHQSGLVLQDADRREEAIAAFRRAIETRPDFGEAYASLGNCLIRTGRQAEAVAVFREATKAASVDLAALSNLLFTLNYLPGFPPQAMLEEARRFGEACAAQAEPFAAHDNAPDPARRLRVGLVSGDFGEHPVGHFLAGVLSHLDAESVELFAYETYKRKGELNARLRALVPRWRDASSKRLDDRVLARLIREDGIDILIDLAGHTGNNRLPLFAWKPAPVQVAWLGYFATTGLQAMDWILADPWVLPPEEEGQFAERPWRLPESYYCFTTPDAALEPGALPALKAGRITFGCFNNLAKVNDEVMACWARVLQAVPGSRLFLKTRALGDAAVASDCRAHFASHGIGPDRLLLEGASPRDEYLAAYGRVDIALDPFPFPGGATSVEGLWMGVPVLTLKGDRFISHQGETIMRNLGLPEWIADNEDEYVAKAAAFAADLEGVSVLHAKLRDQLAASPLCDAPRFARNLEAAFRGMWREWCARQAGRPPHAG